MSHKREVDDLRYCESCGISFLWTIGEQRAAAAVSATVAAPRLCYGCRVLHPQQPRERGLVKWYNRKKRFGFIVRQGQPEIFVHGASLRGARTLSPEDLVEFEITETDKGLAAVAVKILQSARAAGG